MADSHRIEIVRKDYLSFPPDALFWGSSLEVRSNLFVLGSSCQEALFHSLYEPKHSCENRSCCFDDWSPSTLPVFKLNQSRRVSPATKEIPELKISHDWTFFSNYSGSISVIPKEVQGSFESLFPLNVLQDKSKPILFHEEVCFWDDDLHDNGSSTFVARIRVMEDFWYLMLECSISLTGIGSRRFSTRYYHSFGSNVVVRNIMLNDPFIGNEQICHKLLL